jgi:serine/threonine protein kinase
VLKGLSYLHQQGVLHRDIKGANILTNKDGLVKLGDFGTALSLIDSKNENDVVGTPYWMAPEIIEMQPPTSACDIWSVGCTLIELLTGRPPYFNLAPMAALYRIVQDTHPPLNFDGTEKLNAFLLACFRKPARARATADELLGHPWIKGNKRRNLEREATNVQTLSGVEAENVRNTIKLFQRTATKDGEGGGRPRGSSCGNSAEYRVGSPAEQGSGTGTITRKQSYSFSGGELLPADGDMTNNSDDNTIEIKGSRDMGVDRTKTEESGSIRMASPVTITTTSGQQPPPAASTSPVPPSSMDSVNTVDMQARLVGGDQT